MTEAHTNQNGLLAYGRTIKIILFFFFSIHFKLFGMKFPEEIVADSEKLFVCCIRSELEPIYSEIYKRISRGTSLKLK